MKGVAVGVCVEGERAMRSTGSGLKGDVGGRDRKTHRPLALQIN